MVKGVLEAPNRVVVGVCSPVVECLVDASKDVGVQASVKLGVDATVASVWMAAVETFFESSRLSEEFRALSRAKEESPPIPGSELSSRLPSELLRFPSVD